MRLFPEPIAPRAPRVLVTVLILAALALVPIVAGAIGEPFYITLAARIVIMALAATGLNLVLGYGGLVSFGHALYVGLGAYTVGIMVFYGATDGWAQLAVALTLAALVALGSGLVCLRTSGMAFIMITLAVAQMFYFLAISLKPYGGDDGLQIATRSRFGLFSIESNTGLYYCALVLLLAAMYLSWRLVHARFGRVQRGMRTNVRRMRVLGFPTLRYQLAAYVMSGCICAVAGLLLANLTKFTSPAYFAWTLSGDLIVMVMLGGIATILGPVIGAVAFIVLETALSDYTQHWMLFLGPIIVLIALLARRGLYGLVAR
jgi:branched-chain amino acid transport system permease protein